MTSAQAGSGAAGGGGGDTLTAAAIAALVGGTVQGNERATVGSIAALDRARGDQLSFCSSAKYGALMSASRAGIVLVSAETAALPSSAKARITVGNPYEALLSLIPRFYRLPARTPGVHPTAVIGTGVVLGDAPSIGPCAVIEPGAVLGDRATVGAHAVVGAGVVLGDDVHLYPGVTVYAGARLGSRVTIHAGARIGSDGFGYVFREGAHQKLPHVGGCIIEDDVEIGANTTIDRGSIDDTVVGAGTKIDNLVQVAHNVRIGRLCLLMSQVGVAGSVRIEEGCILAGQVGVSGHHTIGKGATLAAQAGVFGDIPPGETWSGYPARPHKEALRAQAALFRLSGLMRRLERLLAGSERDA
ncbi:MAG TPA: UDP-3-O-(3-hydroxymyristoyl)glucosamine N-acyltransferase [Gemmatimonadaceae bacterium]|nr:UDP-3-O-(3-hydroxymyristoyl)glucosamine N-acyltransferase [Gemmatimonadaceae bacterium]